MAVSETAIPDRRPVLRRYAEWLDLMKRVASGEISPRIGAEIADIMQRDEEMLSVDHILSQRGKTDAE